MRNFASVPCPSHTKASSEPRARRSTCRRSSIAALAFTIAFAHAGAEVDTLPPGHEPRRDIRAELCGQRHRRVLKTRNGASVCEDAALVTHP